MIQLSPSQAQAEARILDWFNHLQFLKAEGNSTNSPHITLGGYAGTGKTTLMAHIRRTLHAKHEKLRVAFVSYTGKAARVLEQNIRSAETVYPQDSVGTIHSLIYSPVVNNNQEITGWSRKPKVEADLIVIDEASMVDQRLWYDLLGYRIPIIAVGDHGQLPPIEGSFNLMAEPQIRLEEIHRQAAENPIIKVSILARELGEIPNQNFGPRVQKLAREDPESGIVVGDVLSDYNEDTLVLCGYNRTRVNLNQHIRGQLGFEDAKPTKGDRVICLRNNHKQRIFNGMLGTISELHEEDDKWYWAEIWMDGEDDPYQGLILREQFGANSALNFTDKRQRTMPGDLFDFGYAMTVHKAQGSQARRVVLFEERFRQMDDLDWKRWLYTGVTRAMEELYVVG